MLINQFNESIILSHKQLITFLIKHDLNHLFDLWIDFLMLSYNDLLLLPKLNLLLLFINQIESGNGSNIDNLIKLSQQLEYKENGNLIHKTVNFLKKRIL